MASSTTTKEIYEEVIEDVIKGVRELFRINGVENSVLQELKHTWRAKLLKSDALSNCNNLQNMHGKETENSAVPDKIIFISQPASQILAVQFPPASLNQQPAREMSNESTANTTTDLPKQTTTTSQKPHQNQTTYTRTSKTAINNAEGPVIKNSDISRFEKVEQTDGVQDSSDEDGSTSWGEECSDSGDLHDEPSLNSEDDISDEDEGFDTENIIVCQYEKIARRYNKWKFYLKSGIMNLDGKDHIFRSFTGDAEW